MSTFPAREVIVQTFLGSRRQVVSKSSQLLLSGVSLIYFVIASFMITMYSWPLLLLVSTLSIPGLPVSVIPPLPFVFHTVLGAWSSETRCRAVAKGRAWRQTAASGLWASWFCLRSAGQAPRALCTSVSLPV